MHSGSYEGQYHFIWRSCQHKCPLILNVLMIYVLRGWYAFYRKAFLFEDKIWLKMRFNLLFFKGNLNEYFHTWAVFAVGLTVVVFVLVSSKIAACTLTNRAFWTDFFTILVIPKLSLTTDWKNKREYLKCLYPSKQGIE